MGPSFRNLIESHLPLVLPGAHDALSARQIARAGFPAYFIGGFPLLGMRYGLPDVGLAGLSEVAVAMADILAATDLPCLVDADDGYGTIDSVRRTIRHFERLGAAALILEDQVSPKRCGHMAGKTVVPSGLMEEKVSAAVAARQNPDLFIIARTDARAVHGLDAALRRGERYVAAGADGLFIEAPRSIDELTAIGGHFDVPLLANMLEGGVTPMLPPAELGALGFDIIIYGIGLALRGAKTMQQNLEMRAPAAS